MSAALAVATPALEARARPRVNTLPKRRLSIFSSASFLLQTRCVCTFAGQAKDHGSGLDGSLEGSLTTA
jgi:hypothetical protein